MGRLIRSELTTLLGLMLKAPIIFDVPDYQTLEHYVERPTLFLKNSTALYLTSFLRALIYRATLQRLESN
jgi:hypothetical protein